MISFIVVDDGALPLNSNNSIVSSKFSKFLVPQTIGSGPFITIFPISYCFLLANFLSPLKLNFHIDPDGTTLGLRDCISS